MLQIPSSLSSMRILVTNDDGIHADGLKVLTRVARHFSDDVWVVAPEVEQSGAGHSLTLHQPLRVRRAAPRRYAVNGTPTDCVLLATKEIIPQKKPVDLVLSGVNRGMNVAEDVTYSGTLAAAMEATLLDIPAIGFSLATKEREIVHWETAEHFAVKVIEQLQGLIMPKGNFLSVNFPHCGIAEAKEIRVAPQGRRKIAEKMEARLDPKGRPYFWIGGGGFAEIDDVAGSDHEWLKNNHVTITPLNMDLTNHNLIGLLEQRVADFTR